MKITRTHLKKLIYEELSKSSINESRIHRKSINEPTIELSSSLEEKFEVVEDQDLLKESEIKIGLSFEEKHHLKINGTTIVIGRIKVIQIPDNVVSGDGFVNLQSAKSVAGIGLDGYFFENQITRFSYAKAETPPKVI